MCLSRHFYTCHIASRPLERNLVVGWHPKTQRTIRFRSLAAIRGTAPQPPLPTCETRAAQQNLTSPSDILISIYTRLEFYRTLRTESVGSTSHVCVAELNIKILWVSRLKSSQRFDQTVLIFGLYNLKTLGIAHSSGKWLPLAVVTCSELDQTCLPLMSHANQAHLRYLVNPAVTQHLMGRLGCLLPCYLISNNCGAGRQLIDSSCQMIVSPEDACQMHLPPLTASVLWFISSSFAT